MESLNSNSQERELHQLQQMQDKAKESCMTSFRLLHSHLKVLSIKEGFEWACVALFDQDKHTFTESLLLNLEHLEKQLDREEFQETKSINSFRKSIDARAQHKREYDRRVNDRLMQSKEGKVGSSKALDAGLVITKSNVTESERHVDQQADRKTVENADLKAQIHEKVFANVALKNELRKLKRNSVDTKFAKPLILGKPVLQPPRNQSIVRQSNAFKSERPNFSKLRFASQVDVNNHVIAPGSSRNSSKESYGSNDMAHNYDLKKDKKKTQDKNRNLKPRKMPSAKTHNTHNACTPKPRSNNQTSSNWPSSKSCEETLKAMQKAYHSRNPSSFSDFKHFVCSTCQKCVFNANHDACITKFLKEVNSRAKIQPNKTRNSNKPVDPTSHTQKPGRKIVTGHSFSPNKSSAVHEKTNTPRSYLRWIPTGRIFNTAGLKWVPTGKTFTSSTTKVDCELPNGSNDYITNPYKCDQTLNVSAGTLNLSADQHPCFMIMASVDNTSGPVPQRKERFYTSAGNPVKEILLKLNLPDHRKLKDGGEGTCFLLTHKIHSHMLIPDRQKDIMKAQVHVSRLSLL
ncbi:hypothetical protein Tco_0766380 [Tanacetum coccineum]